MYHPLTQSTLTYYNKMLQATNVVQPDGTSVGSVYLLTGELGLQYGSRTYPVAYTYDYAGRMKTMTNWSNYGGSTGARVTTWNYDIYRGFLTNKTYDSGIAGPTYTYTGAGRLKTRLWARGITTTYKYGNGGDLTNVIYSDSTPGVTNVYDRLGRLGSVSWTNITDTMTYNLANQLQIESYSGGSLNGLSVTNGYDQYLRRTNLVSLGSTLLNQAIYGYDNASRLSSVTDGNNNSATYSYLANSPLVSQITYKQSGTIRMTTTKQYDYLNRLTQISCAPSAAYTSPLTYNYNYNSANQRTKDTLADGSYWIYSYDSLGQVTNGCKYFANGTLVPGQQFDYTFDTIGNRTQTQSGGNTNGANLRVANYYANNLNQITNRDVPEYTQITGASILTNTVTVNGNTAYRNQEYFWQEITNNNTSTALWTNMIVSGGQSVTGNVYVAKEPEVFQYDLDGNLTNDGRFAYVWDGENRLVSMTNNTGVGPLYGLKFSYDPKGRRIQKVVVNNAVTIYTDNFLYDGWNLISTLNSSSALVNSFMWGSDLSGSQQEAGGVGGLVEMSYYGSSTTNCFPAYDGNGNVMALVNVADGTLAANYDYAAFGEPIRITGVMARNNPFRFSTKYADDESDLLYYGYRYYKPSTGTWPNRDPIEERGGDNMNESMHNAPVLFADKLGLLVLDPVLDPVDPVVDNPTPPQQPTTMDPLNPPAPITPTLPNPTQPNTPPSDPNNPTKTTSCPCKMQRVSPAGGNSYHNEYASSLQGGMPNELLVTTPKGLSAQFDAAIPYDSPETVYEAKTHYEFLFYGPPSLAIYGSMGEQFAREAVVARQCQLAFIIAVDNSKGAWGIGKYFPSYDVQYIPIQY